MNKLTPLLLGSALALTVAETSEAADVNPLVDVQTYVHDLIVSKPYATTNNFTH